MWFIFKKDTDIDSGWKIAGKYLFWAVMGALITTGLVFGGAPILFGLYGIILGAVAVAGLALGFTALRELKEGTDRPNQAAIKVALGFALAMPVFWLAGVVQGLGAFAIAAASAAVVGLAGLSRYFAKRPNDSIARSSGTLQDQPPASQANVATLSEQAAALEAATARATALEAELATLRDASSHAASETESRLSEQAAAYQAADSKTGEVILNDFDALREGLLGDIEAQKAKMEAHLARFEKENASLRQNLQWLSARLAADQASGPQVTSSDGGHPMKRSQSMNNLNASHSSVSMFSKAEWLSGPDHPFAACVDDLLGWMHKIQDGSYAFDARDADGNTPIQWALKVMRRLPKEPTEASRAQLGRLWFFIEMHYSYVYATKGDEPLNLVEMIGDILITVPMYRSFFEANSMDEKHLNVFLGERFRETWSTTFVSSILNPLLQADGLSDDARLAVISCLANNSGMGNRKIVQYLLGQVLLRCQPASSDEDDRLFHLFCDWVLSKQYGLSHNKQKLKDLIKKAPAIQDRHGFSLLAGLWEAYANKAAREGGEWADREKSGGLQDLNELMLADPRCLKNPCQNMKVNVPYFHPELTQLPRPLPYELPRDLGVWVPPIGGNDWHGDWAVRYADEACKYAQRMAQMVREYRASYPLNDGDAFSAAPPPA